MEMKAKGSRSKKNGMKYLAKNKMKRQSIKKNLLIQDTPPGCGIQNVTIS